MTTAEAAERLSKMWGGETIPCVTLTSWARRGVRGVRLGHCRRGREYRFSQRHLNEFFDALQERSA